MAFQDNYWIALKKHDLLSDRIYTVYPWYIPCIYHAYSCNGHLRARLVAQPRLEASDRDFRRSFSVLATERSPTRGWGRPKFREGARTDGEAAGTINSSTDKVWHGCQRLQGSESVASAA